MVDDVDVSPSSARCRSGPWFWFWFCDPAVVVVVGFSAWVSFSWAAARLALADCSPTWAAAGSMVASTWPAETFWPGLTFTAVRTPPAAKLTVRDVAGSTVPVAVTVCETVPTVADTSRVAVLVEELPDESMAP